MQQITIGTKNQIVIPKDVRKKIKGFMPGAKVIVTSVKNQTITLKKVEESWAKRTSGLMTKAWNGRDTEKELNKIRDEWNEKLTNLEELT